MGRGWYTNIKEGGYKLGTLGDCGMIEEDQDDLAKEKEEDKGEVKEEWSRRLQENY